MGKGSLADARDARFACGLCQGSLCLRPMGKGSLADALLTEAIRAIHSGEATGDGQALLFTAKSPSLPLYLPLLHSLNFSRTPSLPSTLCLWRGKTTRKRNSVQPSSPWPRHLGDCDSVPWVPPHHLRAPGGLYLRQVGFFFFFFFFFFGPLFQQFRNVLGGRQRLRGLQGDVVCKGFAVAARLRPDVEQTRRLFYFVIAK